ncbi:type III secretion system outer membrane ring subunit SctC [Pseudomonas citri]|uniref:type III secretion system outer membrane ring subunit SctC n=1 Tax=Pseudomonas citri TaxID=2978349 RepID=UPI0021B633BE|nr:type III secretion system outer membrane ring subunit SctC [Pseudomonas citri]
MFKRLCWLPLLGVLALPALAGVPEDWRVSAYAYEAVETPLTTVLADFAESFGVKLSMRGVNGVVNAKIRSANAEEFLNRLALEHQFQWFLYNGTLYVSPQAEQVSQRLEISADAAPDLKQALTDIGLLDKRFGWGELPDEGVVLVSGPSSYIELIRGFSKEKVKPEEKQQVMTFPLRYASVDDREIRYRDQSVVIPGVANMLNGLLDSRRTPVTPVGFQDTIQAYQNMAEMARGKIQTLAGERETVRPRSGSTSSTRSNKKVVADSRNNALLIYDDPQKYAVYEKLVEQLDVSRNLVEIDAVILDIDRTQLSRLESRWGAQVGSVGFGSSLLTGGSSTLFISDFKRFFADIQALEGQGVASVIANPSVLTLENQPAVIDFSRTVYITATGERVANIQPITAGTSLQVIPRTIPNGAQNRFQLIIDIEDGQIEKTGDSTTPGVKRSTVSTQAVISENRSLVIGGFHVDESGDHIDKVPVLGDLPAVGSLFSSKRRENSRRERLFILTPRLIGDQVDPARYLAQENKSQLAAALAHTGSPGKDVMLREVLATAMGDLVKGRIPVGTKALSSGVAVRDLCKVGDQSLVFRPGMGQWFAGDDYSVAVGVVRNTGKQPRQFEEQSCAGPQTLAVTVWPRALLQPGESAEVFVALRPVAVAGLPGKPSRMSLLPY